MRYSLIAAPIALAASVSAGEYATTSIEVVSALTTYCSSATTLSINGEIHTVTEATTLTITECPCTITHSIIASSTPAVPIVPPLLPSIPTSIQAPTSSTPTIVLSTAPPAPPSSSATLAPYPVFNSTLPISTLGTASATGGTTASFSSSLGPAPTGPGNTPFKGEGERVGASSFGLVVLVGLAAYLL